MPAASYWLILWLVSAIPAGQSCIPAAHEKSTIGQYATRAECEAAWTAAYGEGLADTNYKVLHMCVKATTVMQ